MANDKEQKNTIVLSGRLSYVTIKEPRAIPGTDGEAKYGCSVIINKKDKPQLAKIKAAIQAAIEIGKTKFKWTEKHIAKLEKAFFLDGDERDDMDKNPEYDGCIVIKAKSKSQPGVIDNNKNEIDNLDEVYSGCYGRINITFFPTDKGSKNRIACGLNGVQKLKDGEPLAGRVNVADQFDDEGADEGSDDLDDILG